MDVGRADHAGRKKKKNNTVVAITTTLSGCDDICIIPYICTVLILIADGGYPSS
jgi:hypothetical protein